MIGFLENGRWLTAILKHAFNTSHMGYYLAVLTVHTGCDPFLEWLKPGQYDSTWLTADNRQYKKAVHIIHTRVDKRNNSRSRPVQILDWFTPAICGWSWNNNNNTRIYYIQTNTVYSAQYNIQTILSKSYM